jgi:hypothetical protein
VPDSIKLPGLEGDLQRKLAADLFNHVWSLLDTPSRSAEEDLLMIHAAHASRLLWEEVGTPANHARGEWQVSRVYATVGRSEAALFHAERCLQICTQWGIGDFDLAYAYEALARGHAVSGDQARADHYKVLARESAEAIADDEDRDLVLSDLATLP